jgi:hypothetical protein
MSRATMVKIAFKTKGDPSVYQMFALRIDGTPFNPQSEIHTKFHGRIPRSHIKIVSPA